MAAIRSVLFIVLYFTANVKTQFFDIFQPWNQHYVTTRPTINTKLPQNKNTPRKTTITNTHKQIDFTSFFDVPTKDDGTKQFFKTKPTTDLKTHEYQTDDSIYFENQNGDRRKEKRRPNYETDGVQNNYFTLKPIFAEITTKSTFNNYNYNLHTTKRPNFNNNNRENNYNSRNTERTQYQQSTRKQNNASNNRRLVITNTNTDRPNYNEQTTRKQNIYSNNNRRQDTNLNNERHNHPRTDNYNIDQQNYNEQTTKKQNNYSNNNRRPDTNYNRQENYNTNSNTEQNYNHETNKKQNNYSNNNRRPDSNNYNSDNTNYNRQDIYNTNSNTEQNNYSNNNRRPESSYYTERPNYNRPNYDADSNTGQQNYDQQNNRRPESSYDTEHTTRKNNFRPTNQERPHYTTQNPFHRPLSNDHREPITNRPVKPSDSQEIPSADNPDVITGPDENYMSDTEKRRYLDLAERLCDKHKSQQVNQLQAIPLLPSPDPVRVNISSCLPVNVPLVVGGRVASIQEFPHMALLGWRKLTGIGYSWKCGGSLVSDNFVLTAAHCGYQDRDNSVLPGPPRVVQLGSSFLDDPGAIVVKVKSVIRHPQHKLPKSYNDLAMLKLASKVSFSERIKPACLGFPPPVGDPVIATGWGRTEFGGEQSEELRSVSINIWDFRDCQNILGTSRKLPEGPSRESQVCAGEAAGGKDTCQGDSGGPIQIQDECMWRIVGVTSLGKSCGAAQTPGLYAIAKPVFVAATMFGY